MARLLTRQRAIQKTLARRHLHAGQLVLYDIISIYFEGASQASSLVKCGYNRDRKQGREQIVVGLLCNGQGCPVGVEGYAGNTQDETTVRAKIDELTTRYGIETLIFVSDRGMVTQSKVAALKDAANVHLISALTHRELQTLLKAQVIEEELFELAGARLALSNADEYHAAGTGSLYRVR